MSVSAITIIVCAAFALPTLMMARNIWTYNARVKCLRESRWTGSGHDPYDRLPSYDAMMWRFWVWDINKFL